MGDICLLRALLLCAPCPTVVFYALFLPAQFPTVIFYALHLPAPWDRQVEDMESPLSPMEQARGEHKKQLYSMEQTRGGHAAVKYIPSWELFSIIFSDKLEPWGYRDGFYQLKHVEMCYFRPI